MSAAAETAQRPLEAEAESWPDAPVARVEAERSVRLVSTARSAEQAAVDAARIAVAVGVVLAAQAAAGVGLWAAFGCFSGLRVAHAVAGAARGLGER